MWRWCRTPFAHCAKRTPTFALRCSRGRSSSLSSRGWTSIFWKPTTQAATRGARVAASGRRGAAAGNRRRGRHARVLRSRIVGLLLRLHGMPAARIDKGRIEKWFRLGCTNPAASPLKHTVVRYCDVLRRLGFVFDDPQPAAKPVRPNPFGGEKKECGSASHPFGAGGQDLPRRFGSRTGRRTERPLRPRLHPQREAAAKRPSPNVWSASIPMSRRFGGRVRFAGELDLIANLDCVVSMDSLAMHMASLVATPVGRWGATHPALGFLGYGCPPEGWCSSTCRVVPVRSTDSGAASSAITAVCAFRRRPFSTVWRSACRSVGRRKPAVEAGGFDCLVPKDNDFMKTRIFLFLTLGAFLAGVRIAPRRRRGYA